MRTHFSAQTLAELFRDLYVAERSGTMILSGGGPDRRIHFRHGLIVYAESAQEDEDLGRCLVREGGISAGALREAQESLGGSVGPCDLAMALIQRELVAKDTLMHAARLIVRRVVSAAFRWEGGSAAFDESDESTGLFEADVLSTVEALLAGIESMSGFEPIHEAMRSLDNRLRLKPRAPVPLERLTLSPIQGYILSRLDGNTPLKDVLAILPPGEDETASRFLFGLLVFGVVEYEPPLSDGPFRLADILRDHADRQALETMQERTIRQAYELLREQAPHDVLGVTPGASLAQIERAYDETKSQFSRERLLPSVRERFRSELAVIESRLIEAFLTLTQPERAEAHAAGDEAPAPREPVGPVVVEDLRVRVEMDKPRGKLAAEESNRVADAYYAKARRCMREGDFHNAIQYGKLAISYNASDARYYFMLADCQVRNPEARWQRLAEENFTKATQLDPWNAEYWISLGRFYKKRGLNIRARKQFEEALKLVPASEAVLAELASLGT